jgi:hypothetical protein
MTDLNLLKVDDMILTKNKAGEIISGNFNFNEAAFTGGSEASADAGTETGIAEQYGGRKKKIIKKEFEDLAIPAGLYYFNKNIKSYSMHKEEDNNEILPDSLYEKLLSLAEDKPRTDINKKKNKKYTKNKKNKQSEINNNKKKKKTKKIKIEV